MYRQILSILATIFVKLDLVLELEKNLLIPNVWIFARCRRNRGIQPKNSNQHLLFYISAVVFFPINSSAPVCGFVGFD